MRASWLFAHGLLVTAFACGGTAVIDPASGGAGGTSATSATNTSSASTSSASGGSTTTGVPMGCTTHESCPGGLCIFATGQCAEACGEFCASCSPGTVCDDCATSSCPGCTDCFPACQPLEPGACDEDDPCPPGETCFWELQRCVPLCLPDGGCLDPELTCFDCMSGSCCGCNNCISVCVPE